MPADHPLDPPPFRAPPSDVLPFDPEPVRAVVLAWFYRDGRKLPFRETTDPWAILVSETMAQQTQAARAGEAWRGFMARFPSPAALAEAAPADVLRAWRGLGYNRRAIGLQRAARVIVAEHGGMVPASVEALEALPGVGPYTARAVAVFAFGALVGPVDTNIRRVLGRVVAGQAASAGSREIQRMADALLDPERPADWTHALMDVGATRCRTVRPACPACPLRTWCRSARAGVDDGRRPEALPGRRARWPGREPAAPFETTNRWLRGRIVDRLRDGDGDAWVAFEGSLGTHDEEAVASAIRALASEGLIELHPADPRRARLPPALHPLQAPARGTL